MKTRDLTANLFVLAQRVLPKRLITAVVFRLARIRVTSIKNFLIRQFVRMYSVDIEEIAAPYPDGFETFNSFFIRELKQDARPVAADTNAIASPVDGTVSAVGRIESDVMLQAKGIHYSLEDLLATDTAEAGAYVDGAFATIYLAPFNYHRVHAPLQGKLVAARYVPGTLFSVNDATVSKLPQLFVRNERLVCHYRTHDGPMALVFVGAMNVGSITTKWTGLVRPRQKGVVEQFRLDSGDASLHFEKGDVLGWFNMGSTVILLAPPGSTNDFADIQARQAVKTGQLIGRLADQE